MFKVVITEKGGEPKHLAFEKDEVSIGRIQGNDIVLPKGNISKRHSKLVFRDGRYAVVDLKSTNGTYVNGRKIADATPLSSADKVYVGDFVITLDGPVSADDEAPAAPARRPAPPPPPPPRAAGKPSAAAGRPRPPLLEDDDELDADAEAAPAPRPPARPGPPPPPPPPRAAASSLDDDDEIPVPSSVDSGVEAPLNDELDEDLSAAPARRQAPPVRPPRSLALSDDEDGEDLSVTGNLPRAAVHAASAAAARATPPGGHDIGEPAPAVRPGAPQPSLAALLADDAVSAVLVSGPDTVHLERGGKIEAAALKLGGPEALAATLRAMAAGASPAPDEDAAILDVRLPNGAHLTALFPPLAPGGPVAAIRKPIQTAASLGRIAVAGGLSKELQQLLEACVAARRNLLVSGDATAATSLLGALAAAVPPSSRVVSVGTREAIALALPGWVTLTATGGDEHTASGVIRAAAALRPDYLVVSGLGALDPMEVLRAAAGGQEGILCTIGARSAGEALARLEGLAGGPTTPHGTAVRDLAASTFDLVVHATTLPGGAVRVLEVSDLKSTPDGRLAAETIFAWKGDGAGTAGRFQATGATPRVAAALAGHGAALSGIFRR